MTTQQITDLLDNPKTKFYKDDCSNDYVVELLIAVELIISRKAFFKRKKDYEVLVILNDGPNNSKINHYESSRFRFSSGLHKISRTDFKTSNFNLLKENGVIMNDE